MNALDYKNNDPIGNLLLYLNTRMHLSPAFNPSILPMLESQKSKKELVVGKPGEIIAIAYWLEDDYGYLYNLVPEKGGKLAKQILQVYPPKTIMLDPIGFFQNQPSSSYMGIVKGATVIPFQQTHFAALRLSAPEADTLATHIVAEMVRHSTTLMGILKLRGDDRYHEMIRHYGEKIVQSFSQKQLALFLNYSAEHLNKLINSDSQDR